MSKKYTHYIAAFLILTGLLILRVDTASAAPDGLIFPVIGNTNYSDTFLAYRSGQASNKHHAIDIFASKHSQIISPVNGTVRYVGYPQDSWGWYVVIVDDDGYEYHFMHINNDTPGTDDGQGGPMYAYGPDLVGQYNYGNQNASRVVKGQLIGYVGDSGNAESTPSHLHLEIIYPQYTQMNYNDIPLEGFVNPFTYLNNAEHVTTLSPYPLYGRELLPYGSNVNVETNISKGNFDNDPEIEIVSGAGKGGGPHIKVFNADNTFTGREFYAYNDNFYGGVDVSSGDIDGDGKDEIITGPGKGGGPHVKVFNQLGNVVASFFAYDSRFEGGIRVSSGDIDGDGKDEIITGPGKGGGPHVKVFNANGQVLNEFFAYASSFYGGVDVSSGDIDGDGKDEIITGPGKGGGPHVKVFNANGQVLNEFFAYTSSFYGGVKVSAGNVISNNVGEEIAVAPWANGGSHIKVLDKRGNILKESTYLEPWWSGFYDVAAGDQSVSVSTGNNRRSSVRPVF